MGMMLLFLTQILDRDRSELVGLIPQNVKCWSFCYHCDDVHGHWSQQDEKK